MSKSPISIIGPETTTHHPLPPPIPLPIATTGYWTHVDDLDAPAGEEPQGESRWHEGSPTSHYLDGLRVDLKRAKNWVAEQKRSAKNLPYERMLAWHDMRMMGYGFKWMPKTARPMPQLVAERRYLRELNRRPRGTAKNRGFILNPPIDRKRRLY
jgi:hypothetical protein